MRKDNFFSPEVSKVGKVSKEAAEVR